MAADARGRPAGVVAGGVRPRRGESARGLALASAGRVGRHDCDEIRRGTHASVWDKYLPVLGRRLASFQVPILARGPLPLGAGGLAAGALRPEELDDTEPEAAHGRCGALLILSRANTECRRPREPSLRGHIKLDERAPGREQLSATTTTKLETATTTAIEHYYKSRQAAAAVHGRREQQTRIGLPAIGLLLAGVALVCVLQHAPTCSTFDYPDQHHNSGPPDYDNYRRQQQQQLQREFVTDSSAYVGSGASQWFRRPKRRTPEHLMSFYDDGSLAGPTDATAPTGSFSQDQASVSGPSGAAFSWTSIFGGGGGGGGSSSNGGGGGDALDMHVKAILVPRVSGTPGNVQVRQYIVDALRSNDYHVELDEFTASTPIGSVKFANIIASSNPGACRQLVLACHYDSKLQAGFLGATDSAVPCAMLLRISETFGKSFRGRDEATLAPAGEAAQPARPQDELGLRFIFFDGEEAFAQWSATDSLYGSRHLAAKWAKQPAPGQCTGAAADGSRKKLASELDRLELFVLLDLIGASDSSFVMYNPQLRHHYQALQKHERAFLSAQANNLSMAQARQEAAFKARGMRLELVEDDHVPFRKRGVPILLLLSHPFPRVWHTNADNYQAIDWPRTRRILHVLEQFVSGYPDHK